MPNGTTPEEERRRQEREHRYKKAEEAARAAWQLGLENEQEAAEREHEAALKEQGRQRQKAEEEALKVKKAEENVLARIRQEGEAARRKYNEAIHQEFEEKEKSEEEALKTKQAEEKALAFTTYKDESRGRSGYADAYGSKQEDLSYQKYLPSASRPDFATPPVPARKSPIPESQIRKQTLVITAQPSCHAEVETPREQWPLPPTPALSNRNGRSLSRTTTCTHYYEAEEYLGSSDDGRKEMHSKAHERAKSLTLPTCPPTPLKRSNAPGHALTILSPSAFIKRNDYYEDLKTPMPPGSWLRDELDPKNWPADVSTTGVCKLSSSSGKEGQSREVRSLV
ncbi:hypothetical protein QBC32DRAFT_312836 [Pseudoneurospora amorphoporcata]|uniref:Uncharacterized protein n=1 Tax=Pseudoneurospora amorphoporcata TaxID=241081 RepID=A0AAN6NX68_9PEZI|nr:hypothetical protein QBC32DRAFT_312836 [Pseudoneurospora amorphoporcata]